MAYDITLVEFHGENGSIYNNYNTQPLHNFTGNFTFLLLSMWVCLPAQNIGGGKYTGADLTIAVGGNSVVADLQRITVGLSSASTTLFAGTYTSPAIPINTRYNLLVSADTTTKTVQVYVNDTQIPLTSGGWLHVGPSDPMWGSTGYAARTYHYGYLNSAMADVWMAPTPTFVDLTVKSNRRKFINSNLTPVDLGIHGENPFDYEPPIFLTVPTGGVANDFRTNYGSGNASLTLTSTSLLSLILQNPLNCALPTPPSTDPTLRMDNLVVTSLVSQSPCMPNFDPNLPVTTAAPKCYLRWSDTRGATWGNSVGQEFTSDPYAQLQWNRLGYARDRVFEIYWASGLQTALNGAFVEVAPLKT